MGKLQVVVGGQFGSEGKGALALWLVQRQWRPVFAVRVAGPNAGHTAYDDNGRQFKLQQIPVAALARQITPGAIALGIAAGSEIDLQVLETEITALNEAGHDVTSRLYIDGQATLIAPHHVIEEHGSSPVHGESGLTKRIGSTGKGVGAARAARIMREAQIFESLGRGPVNVAQMIRGALGRDHVVQIEGTQGFGLGLHAGFYPYCTSSDCRAIDFMSMAGVSPWALYVNVEVWVALRSHPIRVAGDSGPLLDETTWEAIGQEPEYTTVTKKVRRVGSWDGALARRAIAENGGRPVKVALMFGDYIEPEIKGRMMLSRLQHSWLRRLEDDLEHSIDAVGTSPTTIAEVID